MLNEPDKFAQSKPYMWVPCGGPPGYCVVWFNYEPSRATQVPVQLLSGNSGVLMTDGYQPYRTAAAQRGLIHLCCWAHVRSNFKETQRVHPKGKPDKVDMAISLFAKLYAVGKVRVQRCRYATLYPTGTQCSRITKIVHLAGKTSLQLPSKSANGKAVNYMLKYWQELSGYV